jgi:hypothetical protein
MKDSDLLVLGALGVGGYLLWQWLNSSSPNNPVNSIASSIANTFVNLTSPALSVPQGSVVMPDGSYFPTSQLTSMDEGFDQGALTFLYSDGNTYQLSPVNAQGNYVASLCTDCE